MNRIYFYISLAFLIISQSACDTIGIVSPPGPSGKSAYEVWVESVNSKEISWSLGTDVANYFKFLKGENGNPGKDAYLIWKGWIKDGSVDNPHEKGKKWSSANDTKRHFYLFLSGAKGEDGLTPFINDKGNWQIGDVDTNIPAKGPKGDKGEQGNQGPKGDKGNAGNDGHTPVVTINNGTWHIDGVDTHVKATGPKGDKGNAGNDGHTPMVTITNGTWHIDGADTNVKATGPKGDKGDKGNTGSQGSKGDKGNTGSQGRTPVITIENGTWHIDGVDTHVKATGPKGDKGDRGEQGQADGSGGTNGKSAYEIWKEEVGKGDIKYDITNTWPDSKTDLNHFWLYIQGKDPDGNGGGSSSGSTNVDLEQTKISVFASLEFVPDENGMYGYTIHITTEPNATVYYHIYGEIADLVVYSVVANNEGIAIISEIDGYSLKTTYGDKRVYNIWTKVKGKLQSPHIHLMPSSFMPV